MSNGDDTARPRVSVVVCTYDRAGVLGDCLDSLLAQDHPGERYEIVVVDDGSGDDTRAVVEARQGAASGPRVRYVYKHNGGLNSARNRGVDEARGELVSFLDDDELAPAGHLRRITGRFDEDPGLDGVGGPYRDLDDDDALPTCERCSLGAHAMPHERATTVDHLFGGNMTLRRDAFATVGPFDEGISRQGSARGDESEWFSRASGRLRLLYDPEIWIWHRRDLFDLRTLLRHSFMQGWSMPEIRWKQGQSARPRPLRMARGLAHAARYRCAQGLVVGTRELGSGLGWLRLLALRAARRWRQVAVVVFIALLGSLALGELALRIVLDEEVANGNYWGRGAFVADPAAGYRHTPGFRGRAVRPGAFSQPVAISAEGLRQRDVPRQLTYDRRLLILGDSFPFGLGVAVEDAFPARLKTVLNPRGVGVVNGAQTGYDIHQELAWGRRLLARVEPDTVLLSVFLANDLQDDYRRSHERIEVVNGYRLRRDRPLATPWLDALRTRSFLWMRLASVLDMRRQRQVRREFRHALVQDPSAVLNASLEPLMELRALCAGCGRRFAVTLIPERRGRDPLREEFRSALSDAGVPWLDLSPLATDDNYLQGDGHWSPAGHAAAARRLLPFIEGLVAGAPVARAGSCPSAGDGERTPDTPTGFPGP